MGLSDEYEDLLEFVKMFLMLFHGQSKIERGFSVNKQLLVKNLKGKSLVALWGIKCRKNISELSPETIKISSEWIKSVKEADRLCQYELGKLKKQKQESQKSLKLKVFADGINALKEKRVKLISEIEILCVGANLLDVKAEKLHDFRYLTQSNQQKNRADEK